jgi:hypothetical protein
VSTINDNSEYKEMMQAFIALAFKPHETDVRLEKMHALVRVAANDM